MKLKENKKMVKVAQERTLKRLVWLIYYTCLPLTSSEKFSAYLLFDTIILTFYKTTCSIFYV